MNTKESFSTRLAQLRTDEEISAREMSTADPRAHSGRYV